MATIEKIMKAEKWILDNGCYLAVPANSQILLTASEQAVLNTIRHLTRTGTSAISMSLLAVCTGLTDKTIKRAIDSLIDMKMMTRGAISKKGTNYNVNYQGYTGAIERLNREPSPVGRLRLADDIRGCGKALHTSLIAEYTGSEFDSKLK